MWLAAGTAVVVAAVIALVYVVLNGPGSTASGPPKLPSSAPSINGIHCNAKEQSTYHQHAKLDIYVHGKLYTVPPFVGIPDYANCLYWLHTHSLQSYPQGVIHMEYPASPPKPTPTLLEFLHVWQKTRADEDKPVPTILRGGPNVHIYVNRKPYHGSLASIKLHPHELIAIEIGKQYVKPPTFNFATYGL